MLSKKLKGVLWDDKEKTPKSSFRKNSMESKTFQRLFWIALLQWMLEFFLTWPLSTLFPMLVLFICLFQPYYKTRCWGFFFFHLFFIFIGFVMHIYNYTTLIVTCTHTCVLLYNLSEMFFWHSNNLKFSFGNDI